MILEYARGRPMRQAKLCTTREALLGAVGTVHNRCWIAPRLGQSVKLPQAPNPSAFQACLRSDSGSAC